jgi:endonuclease YncB( thermonuclease family)
MREAMRHIHRFMLTGVLFVQLVVGAAEETPALLQARVAEVIDGDTLRVWIEGKEDLVRYLAIEAPELTEPGGYESRKAHEGLVAGGDVWLECEPDDEGRPKRDGRKRLLAYVFLDEKGKRCANTELVRQGAAKVGVRAVRDDTPADAFSLKRLPELLAAQLEAATSRAGWWGKGDPYTAADFIVCFIKFWGDDEVCWLLNRGTAPVDLTSAWQLADKDETNSVVLAQRVPAGELALAPGGVCRVHTGPDARTPAVQHAGKAVDLQWKRARVWNNTGDRATLRDPKGAVVYTYLYRAAGG